MIQQAPTAGVSAVTVYRRGNVYHCAYTSPLTGKRVVKSTGIYFPDEDLARISAGRMCFNDQLVAMGMLDPVEHEAKERGSIAISKAINEHLPVVASDRQRPERRGALQAFTKHSGIKTASGFGDRSIGDRIEAFLAAESRRGLSPETVNKKLWHIQAFSKWLKKLRYIAVDHAADAEPIAGKNVRKCLHRALTPAEAERLFATSNGLLHRFRCWTGLRHSEAQRIRRSDLDLSDKPTLTIRPEVAKNRLGCVVPLEPTLAAMLAEQFSYFAPHARIFGRTPSRRGHTGLLADIEDAGIDSTEINERSLRMTFVSWLEAAGVELGLRMKLRRDSGRGSERLTLWNYSDARQTMAILRKAIDTLGQWYAAELKQPAEKRA